MKKLFTLIFTLLLSAVYSQKDLEVTYKRKKDNSVSFYYQKNVPGSYYLSIEFTKLENCDNSTTYTKIVKHSSGSLLTLKPDDPKQGISFGYKMKYSFGNPNPKINTKVIYVPPFKKDTTVKIYEAESTEQIYFGSEEPINWKSFVAYSEKSDTICAMRKGTVVRINNEYANNNNKKLITTTKRNSIIIEHKDGTYASYQGFDRDEIYVKLGQKIIPQTPIGKLEKFNDKYRLDFNIYHYLKNLLSEEKSTYKKRKFKTKYLNPNFSVNDETSKISSGNYYKVSFNEELKLQEFTKREKKKYAKSMKK